MERNRMKSAMRRVSRAAGAAMISGLLAAVTVPAALAQDASTVLAERQVAFDIPPQALADALTAFGQQSGVQVSVDGALVRSARSPGVSGTMTPREALAQLLAGTGFGYSLSGADTVNLHALDGGGEQGVLTLEPITVEGRAVPGQARIDSLPPAYPGGQVARGALTGMLGNRDFLDTPYSVTSYTAQTIEDQQASTVGDVMANDPSVRSDYARGTGSDEFTIRGFTVFNRDISFNGLYGIAPFYTTPVSGLERVEVIKGPNALLNGVTPYGSIGGTINVVPKRAGDVPVTSLTPTYMSDTQFGGRADVGRRFGRDETFGLRVNGEFRDGDTPVKDRSERFGTASAAFDWRGERARLEADFGYYRKDTEGQQGLLFDFAVPVPDAPDANDNFFPSWTYYDEQDFFGMVRGEFDILPNLTAYVAGGARHMDLDSLQTSWLLQDESGLIASRPHYINAYDDTQSGEIGLTGDFRLLDTRHQVTVSGSRYHEEYGQLSTRLDTIFSNLHDPVSLERPTLPSYGDLPKTSETDLSSIAFADVVSFWDDRVQLTLGARRQQVGSKNFDPTTGAVTSEYDKSKVTPTVGFLVKPWENVSVYASYIQGLQQGPTAPTTAVNAGEVFAPFVSEQYEVGIKLDQGDIAATLSAFQITQPNGVTDPTTNVFSVDGEQRNRGIEFTLFGEVTESVRLLGGLTYLDADLTKTQGGTNDGKTAVAVPHFQGVLGAEWDTPFVPGLTLTGRGIYSSSQYLDSANTLELPSWVRFDLGARYRIGAWGTPIIIRANVENLLDNDYWASAARETLVQGAPRTFLLSTTFNF